MTINAGNGGCGGGAINYMASTLTPRPPRHGMGFTNHDLMAQTTQTNEEWLCVHALEEEVE